MTGFEPEPQVHELTLQPVAEDVRAARAFAVNALAGHATDDETGEDFLDAAATITSELVTNSFNAGAGLIRLTLLVGATGVTISVTDDAAGIVSPAAHDVLALSGRGLRIVETLSRRWGVAEDPAGKRVWAELEFPLEVDPRPAPTPR